MDKQKIGKIIAGYIEDNWGSITKQAQKGARQKPGAILVEDSSDDSASNTIHLNNEREYRSLLEIVTTPLAGAHKVQRAILDCDPSQFVIVFATVGGGYIVLYKGYFNEGVFSSKPSSLELESELQWIE
jgi:hypothetical protein